MRVEARLRTDEEVALGIELEAGTKVSHEVFVAEVVGVVAIAASLTVDTSVDRADATAKFKIRVAREFGCINGVEVKKDWSETEEWSHRRSCLGLPSSRFRCRYRNCGRRGRRR